MCWLNLDRSLMTVPCPPRLPTDKLASPFEACLTTSYTLPSPYILPSPSFIDSDACSQISTCICTTETSYSVSITYKETLVTEDSFWDCGRNSQLLVFSSIADSYC
ncbi:hypothetical protein DFH28DRAFT_153053 [Melampsora americana]|nr:hypothetical protein DFH28DRAFT_153053 [Melampsora americana]